MLHIVSDDVMLDDLKPYLISNASFARLLDTLQAEGYTTIGYEDVARNQGKSSGKEVIITFDDCPKNLWDYAIPQLIARGMKAVFYMPTAYLGSYNKWNVAEGLSRLELMDETDIKKLAAAGMEVGSHSHHHIELEFASRNQVLNELSKSKSILEDLTGKEVISIAYPYGSVPKEYKGILKECGYQYGVGVYVPFENDYATRRWIYHDGDDAGRIKKKLSTTYSFVRIFRDKIAHYKKFLNKVYSLYDKGRKVYMFDEEDDDKLKG